MMKKDCVFCSIKKEEKILETRYCYVYPDRYPLSKGHLLVIPKKHYESIVEIPDDVLYDVIKTIKLMEKKLIKKLKVKGMDIRENYRPFIPESTMRKNHIHFHVIPRSWKDVIFTQKGSVKRREISAREKGRLIKLLKV